MITITVTIGILYSCHECGLSSIEVQVPAQEARNVIDWLEQVMMPRLIADHTSRSPKCETQSLQEVYIPVTGANRIGGAPVN